MNKAIGEEEYDRIMSEARRAFERHEKVGDAYSFHKAFEWATREIENHHILDEALIEQHKDDIDSSIMFGEKLSDLNKTELAVCVVVLGNICSRAHTDINEILERF